MFLPRLAPFLLVLWPLWADAQTLTVADSVQSYATVTNTTVTMTGRSELHVTGTSNPIAGSTIHLNSPDSWFVFDNIRPTTADNYLGQIKVEGANAVHGNNVRVVQFGKGTLIARFKSDEQALETFTGPKFTGDSKRYNLYTYYNSAAELGTMDGNISSFKLKRGFMATFATEANGSGTSKVYIAQDHDLTIAAMPGSLGNAIRFVRVFPWRWVSKKGACDLEADTLKAAWFYNWNNDRNSTLDWEYVPIRQQKHWPAYPTDKTNVTHLSGYNEPDNPVEDSYTTLGSGSRDAAIAAWPEFLATGLRVGSPACTDGGSWWLYEFMDKAAAANLRVDYVAVHFYRCGFNATSLYNYLKEIHDRTGKPLWVTEFNNGANWTNCGDPSYSGNASTINSFIDMMDNTPWIERYAVFGNVESVRHMVYNDGSLTPAGVVYRDQQSPVGYVQEQYPLSVKREVFQLSLDGDTRDTSGYDNRGVYYGAPAYAAGQYGQALQLNGSTGYVRMPRGVVNTNSLTFAAWVNWDGGATNQRIFDFGNDTDQFFFLSPDASGQMRAGLRNNSGTTDSISTTSLPVGTWQHVAVTMQGSTAKLYLNGVLQVEGTLPDAALANTLRNYLGRSQWPDDPLFKGRLDEVVLVDTAMSEAQIVGLMNNTQSSFSAYWKGDAGGNWSTNNAGNTNWATDAAAATDAGKLPGVNTAVNFSAVGANSGAMTLGGDFSIDGLAVATSSAVGIGGTHALTIGKSGIDVTSGAGVVTISTSGQLNVGAAQTWTNNSPSAFTVTSALAGSANLTVTGPGPFVFAGTNAATGDLSIMGGGSVRASSIANAVGSFTQVGLGGGGTTGALVYTGGGEISGRVITFQGGYGSPGVVIDQAGSGLLKFTANTTSIASVSKALTLQGSTSGTGEFAGVIANGGTTTSLTKAGTGTWTLSGANTYTGTTTLSAGTLAIGSNAAFGTGTLDLRGAVIKASDSTARTIGNAISFSADTTFTGTGNLLFTGAVNGGTLAKTLNVTNPQTEFSGVLSNSGARIKTGSGILIFSGANSYTGATTVSAGTLAINGSLATGSAVTVANGATLTGTGNVKGATTFANGSRLGWSLVANTGIAGKLTAGAVNVTSGASANFVFDGPGSTVDFTDVFWEQSHTWQVLTSSAMTGTFTLGTISPDSAGHSHASYGTFYLLQNSTGIKLFFAPTGALPPPTPTGFSVSVFPGGVTLAWNAPLEDVSYNVLRSTHSGGPYELIATDVVGTSYTDRSVTNGSTYYYVIVAMSPNGGSDPTAEIAATPHLPVIIEKADNATPLGQSASWSGGIVPVASDTAKWIGLSGANSVSLGSNTSWNGIVVGATGGPVAIAAGHSLALGTAGIDMSAATQNLSISSSLTLAGGNQNWFVVNGKTLALSVGTFARSAATTLNIQGAGTVANTMAGLTSTGDASTPQQSGASMVGPWLTAATGTSTRYGILVGGAITSYTSATPQTLATAWGGIPSGGNGTTNYDISANGALGSMGQLRTINTIRYSGTGANQTGNTANADLLSVNGLLNAGTGTFTIGTNNNVDNDRPFNTSVGANKDLVLHAANGGITFLNVIKNNAGGASAVTVTGAKTVTLSGANTFTGGVNLNSGTLLAGNAAALGTTAGSLKLKGGTFGTTAGLTIANPVNVIGTNILGHATQANDFTLSGALTGNGTLKNFTGASTGPNLFFTGNLSGFTGTLDFTCRTSDTQCWRFGANNATVDLSNAAVIVRVGNVTNSAVFGKNFGFTDGISGATLTLGSLAGDGVFQASYNNAGPNTLIVGSLHADTTFSGVLGVPNGGSKMNLTKIGTGTLTLTGTNPYTGATTINAGTLMLNGSLTGNSAVAVNSGGTLAGSGTSSGAVTVAGGGAISPGNGSGGVLTISGALTLHDGSALNITIGAASSRIALGGALTAGGTTTVNVTALAGFGPGDYSLITGAAGINPSTFEMGTTPGAYICTLSVNNGTLWLKIEEPLTAPASLTASDGSQSIALAWTASSAATSYTVKRSTISGDGYEPIATGVTDTNYADTGLAIGSTYYYVVSSVNLTGESEDSMEASALALSVSEAWRKEHFGFTDNAGTAADMADPDLDGMVNLVEYAIGSAPNLPTATASPHAMIVDGRLTVAFTRNTAATDVVLTVLGMDDLASEATQPVARSAGGSAFTDEIDGIPTGAPVGETGTGTIRSVQVGDLYQTNDPAHPRRFLKLHVGRD